MNENNNSPNHYNSSSQIYKNLYSCAGLKCSNKPITKLKIKYINKEGFFCQRCTDNLIQSDLAERIEEWN